jgi:hypothetical protein
MADPAQVGQMLDEDDDFVEFEADDWNQGSNLNRKDLWDADWFDKDSTEDAVAQQIRTELEKKAASQGQQ